jgi:hypothetical protein
MLIMPEETAEAITAFCETWTNKDFNSTDDIQNDLNEIIEQLERASSYTIISKDSEDEP